MNDQIVGYVVKAATVTIITLAAQVKVKDKHITKLKRQVRIRNQKIDFMKRQMLFSLDLMNEEQCEKFAKKFEEDMQFEKIIEKMV